MEGLGPTGRERNRAGRCYGLLRGKSGSPCAAEDGERRHFFRCRPIGQFLLCRVIHYVTGGSVKEVNCQSNGWFSMLRLETHRDNEEEEDEDTLDLLLTALPF